MKAFSFVRSTRFAMLGLAALCSAHAPTLPAQGTPRSPTSLVGPLGYPPTPRGGQADDLGGIRVPDPYRWLENVASPDVREWVAAQNALMESYLAQLPRRREIRDQVVRSWTYRRIGASFAAGMRLFFYENSTGENQPVLYVQDRAAAPPRMLIDPNAFSQDGLIAIVDQSPSPDGKYLAYAVSTQGTAWHVIRVRDVRTSQDLGDELEGVKESPLAWTNDERGFFYVRSDRLRPASAGPTPSPASSPVEGRQRVFYHRVGRSQSDDQLVFENTEHPDWRLRADVSQDGQYVVIAARSGTELQNRLYFIDLDNPKRPNLGAPLVTLFDAADASYDFVASEGPVFFIRTTKGAPRARLVAVDINTPDANQWTTVVRETYDPLIEVRRVDDRIVAHRLHDAHSVLELYALDGGVRGSVPLPGVGTVAEINGRPQNREFYFTFTSFLQPPSAYRYDLDARNVLAFKESRADTLLARYETTQLFFTSKDGTRVPMFITARRGITLDGTHATLLAGNGTFNVAMTPAFDPSIAAWLELGGIYAAANIRGGGEYGRAWHDAAAGGASGGVAAGAGGGGARKQVAIDDFISAAEFLINQRYTKSSLLGITGRGPGGVIVGAAMTQRPELFGAAVIDGGLFDMTRFNRFTIGATWTPEFGSPDRPADLPALLAYSPMHAVRPGTHYPATLLTAGDHDDVVFPAHSYKFAATLQAAHVGAAPPSPVLLHVDYNVGHGPGVPTSTLIALDADRLTFLVNALRPPW